MKKILLVVMVMTLILSFTYQANAFTWCFGPGDCKDKSGVKVNAMGEPTQLPTLAVLPTYTIGLNAIWLLDQNGLYSGPHMNIAKLANLVTVQGQYAMAIVSDGESETEEGPVPNYYGVNIVVTVADLITKLGGEPGDFILTFNPALGYTGGFKTEAGFDHGPVINVVNADLEKLCKLVGLCK